MIELLAIVGGIIVLGLVARTAYDLGYQHGYDDGLDAAPQYTATVKEFTATVDAMRAEVEKRP